MRIVKVGGSLSRAAALPGLLATLAARPGTVVVPGGGPFADEVRGLQRRWRFDDAAAHAMALLAMDQLGRLYAALEGRLAPVASLAAVSEAVAAGRVPVWLPATELAGDRSLPASWRVTSDSLAVWLAGRLGAPEALLLKAAPVAEGRDLAVLAAEGVVDPALPGYAEAGGVAVRVLGPATARGLAAALAGPAASARAAAATRRR